MKPNTLKRNLKKVEWHNIEEDFTMPAAQGSLLNALLYQYFVGKGKAKVLEIGWTLDIVAIKTAKQVIAWKDTGIGARFLGIVNRLDGTVEQHPDDTEKKQEICFKTYKELQEEIKKRDYNNILGLKAQITKEEFDYFLNVLPPFKYIKNGFLLSEALSDQLYYQFTEKAGKTFFAEVVKLEDEEIMKIEATY